MADGGKQIVFTEKAPKPLGTYSQAVVSPPGWRQVQLCGQIPLRSDGSLALDSIESQTRQVFENIRSVAEAAGGTTSHITKLTVYLTNMEHLRVVNQIMPEYFQTPYPARSAVGVASLVAQAEIEIDGVMHLPAN